jgi:hypothetical protein
MDLATQMIVFRDQYNEKNIQLQRQLNEKIQQINHTTQKQVQQHPRGSELFAEKQQLKN